MSLRIHRSRANDNEVPQANGAPPAGQGDNWIARLVKMIPAEAIAVYSTALPYLKDGHHALAITAAIALLVGIVTRAAATMEQGKRPQLVPLLVAAVSFGLWLMTLPPAQSPLRMSAGWEYLPIVLTLGWVAIVPLFYKGEDYQQP